MTLDVKTFAVSAEEDSESNKESCIAESSDGNAGGLREDMSEWSTVRRSTVTDRIPSMTSVILPLRACNPSTKFKKLLRIERRTPRNS